MKWTHLPTAPLKFNPYQDAFWKAHRARLCKACKIEFDTPPHFVCPQCKSVGLRKFNRLALIAGRRGGKTKAASIAAVEAATIPNSIIWATAPTFPKLARYVIPALQELIPESWIESWSAEFYDLRLKNGSLIHGQSLENPDQGRGQGVDLIWLDEASELTEAHWEVIRPSLTERRGAVIISTSPRGYDWVHRSFYAQAQANVPGYWACRYATSQNPIISLDEIAEAKATMSDTMYRQEYEADFVVFTGAVFGESIEPQVLYSIPAVQQLIPEWPQIDPWRQVIVGIDTGADHPFGAVKLVSTDKGLVVVGEYLQRDKTFIQHASNLKLLAQSPTTRWAINKNERQQSLELAQHGIFCQKAENDQMAGNERVKSWLASRQLWFVRDTCPETIKQLKTYRYAENTSPKTEEKRKERVFKKDDELPDSLRYALMTWPMLPKPFVADANKPRDLSGLPDEMRFNIERMRKIDQDIGKLKPTDITGDFYL